jgi:uncharacterized protein (TIGR02145 family)
MMRIFMEDQELDIYSDFTNNITYAIDDLLNLDSKATSFTKTIIIPGTTINNRLFGNIFEFANSNFSVSNNNVFYDFNASKSARARIDVNGLQVLKGVLRLLKIVHDNENIEYEVAIFGELGGLVSAIGNKKLENIDLSKYNHTWNADYITDTWNPIYIINYTNTYQIYSSKTIYLLYDKVRSLQKGDTITISGTISNNKIFTIRYISYGLTGTSIGVNESTIAELSTGLTITKMNTGLGIGYTYPLINYGNVTFNVPAASQTPTYLKYRDWQYEAFRPAIYVKEYIDQILNSAGYTYKSSFFETNFFKRLIVPNNDANLFKIGESYYIDADASGNLSGGLVDSRPGQIYNAGSSYTYQHQGIYQLTIPFTNTSLNDFSYSSNTYYYTASTARNLSYRINIIGLWTRSGNYDVLYLRVLKNNVVIQQLELGKSTFSNTLEFNLDTKNTDNIKCELYFAWNKITSTQTYTYNYTIDYSVEFFVEPNPKGFVPYSYGQTINMNNAIPRNIQQRDFLTSIMKMFNLMITEDKYKEKHLIIEPDITFYNTDRTTYLDWSNKVDRSKPITITPMSEANSRYYEFKYKDDSDYFNDKYKKKFNESYGSRQYDNQLEFAKDTQKVELIFSPSVLEGQANEDKIWTSIYKDNNGLEDRTAHNIRIMQVKKITGVNSWNILNSSSAVKTGLTEYLYAGHFNDPDYPTSDLNWGATRELYFSIIQASLQNNLFNGFYSSYMAEITDKDSRLVSCTMKLTDIDMFNLDWRRFIFIDGVIYRLKKIIDWSDDNLCKVELLRAINTTYLLDFITFDTMTIGNQIWSSQNLNTIYYNNGDAIPIAYSDAEWDAYTNANIGCCSFFKYAEQDSQYGLDSGYGLYYNYYVLEDSRGVIPNGYRLPTRTDWETLDSNTGGNALKSLVEWNGSNTNTNTTQFSAYGLGYIDTDGTPRDNGTNAYYWATTDGASGYKYYMMLGYTSDLLKTDSTLRKQVGLNVRLIKI